MKKKFIFLTIMCLLGLKPSIGFASETYWKVEKVKPIMQTSIIFESMLNSLSEDPFYIVYDGEKDALSYYVDDKTIKPLGDSFMTVNGKPVKNRIETKIVGDKLKIMIYQSNDNIALLICGKAADNKSDFLKEAKASKQKPAKDNQ